MAQPPILVQTERRRKVAGILREYLRPYDLQDVIDETELQIRELFVAENTGSQHVSRAILDTMFPRVPPCDLYHYTNLLNLRSIASSGQLRLYAVRKRLDQGELKPFAKVHSLKGYLDSSQGQPFVNELSDDRFYASMTRKSLEKSAMTPPKNRFGGFAPESPRSKETKIQRSSVRPTRKPTWMTRRSAVSPLRRAARRARGSSYQEPPRTTWRLHSPSSIQAEPFFGAPL
jgi:hypothetical protein